ncbi:MAG: hypothetical protein GVY06_05100 [Alphaproteobacteria bacterium]|jgi:hypothetical protein|nr:hypothetical protein [Alphaproteobacteria bacterium]
MSANLTIHSFGEPAEPVAVIDDYVRDPAALRAQALKAEYAPAGHHYPGDRARAPAAYLEERGDLLRNVLADLFGMRAGARLVECSYSIVTTPPDKLTPIQRMPHFDGVEPNRIAVLHYLSGPEFGGTSFYRHRATGFETVTAARYEAYSMALREDVRRHGLPPARYHSGTSEMFELTGTIDAAFNRLVIYRGNRLHSGNILRPHAVGPAPEQARLSINTFLWLNDPAGPHSAG